MTRLHTQLLTVTAVALVLAWPNQAGASLIWFDPSNGGSGFSSFAGLTDAYDAFVSDADRSVSFDGWAEGTLIDDEYGASDGVWFDNAGSGSNRPDGIRREGGNVAEDLTGYDGTFRPGGDNVLVRFANNDPLRPFTIRFDDPVSLVGSLLGMGFQGTTHSLTIRALDDTGTLLGTTQIQSWLWESRTNHQNYETFFALRSDAGNIARVEIRNDSSTNFSNALIFDELRYAAPDPGQVGIPEPANLVLLAFGSVIVLLHARDRSPAGR